MTKRSLLLLPLLILLLTAFSAAPALCGGDKDLTPEQRLAAKLNQATEHFERFARMWLGKLSANYRCTVERVEIERRGDSFVARYFELDPTSLDTAVKPTASNPDTFLGKLKYVEATFESEGHTPELAAKGPFAMVKQVLHSELFSYTNGNWRY